MSRLGDGGGVNLGLDQRNIAHVPNVREKVRVTYEIVSLRDFVASEDRQLQMKRTCNLTPSTAGDKYLEVGRSGRSWPKRAGNGHRPHRGRTHNPRPVPNSQGILAGLILDQERSQGKFVIALDGLGYEL